MLTSTLVPHGPDFGNAPRSLRLQGVSAVCSKSILRAEFGNLHYFYQLGLAGGREPPGALKWPVDCPFLAISELPYNA